ncbi:MAG: dTDP-4-dehydrorhamnose 3,5-epimerase [FCB group bacterium]|nr:dTDP-4-dehydrorhamnose 3,5-epimerase [FCB group bacterium]
MRIEKTPLPGLFILWPKVFEDERGYFFESYREPVFRDLGLPVDFKQDNQAASEKGVLRGLHYQLRYPQGKLVRVSLGEVYDVAVDIRRGSPTFGRYFGTRLSDKNHKMMFVPAGFAHGYCVLSPRAIFQYKCTEIYHPEDEYGVIWNDPELAIDWPVSEPVVSEKDSSLPTLQAVPRDELPKYQE